MTTERGCEQVEERAERIARRILSAAQRVGRAPDSVRLVAVSKKQPIDRVHQFIAWAASKGREVTLGENYVQEFEKKRALLGSPVRAHLIGPLQRNKARIAVQLFDLIETAHSLAVLQAIDDAAAKIHKTQDVLLQVNISRDPKKSGFDPLEMESGALIHAEEYPHLRIRGLMAIPQVYAAPNDARPDFQRLRLLRDRVQRELSAGCYELSMGMSADFEVAIEEGATIVRIGSALFGEREGG